MLNRPHIGLSSAHSLQSRDINHKKGTALRGPQASRLSWLSGVNQPIQRFEQIGGREGFPDRRIESCPQ